MQMIEIERKFLVTSDAYKKEAISKTKTAQGYLSKHPERNVRIRIRGEKAYITIKGASNRSGTSRFEWEKEIDIEEGKSLLSLCERPIIDKYRYEIKSGNHLFEVDEFLDERSEERRVGKECRAEWMKYHQKKERIVTDEL